MACVLGYRDADLGSPTVEVVLVVNLVNVVNVVKISIFAASESESAPTK